MPLLKKYKTDFGTIRITRSKSDGTLAYYQNGCFHSQADRNGVSLCAYIHLMQDIIRQARARRILIIGCAGGTLATMLRQMNCRVTAVDINPMAFTIARRHFRLPADVRCVCRDGIAYLRTTPRTYDAVVVDTFGSDNTVPRAFTTARFFREVKEVLAPEGIMIMNVMTADDKDKRADIIARRVQAAHEDVTLFDWPGEKDRNTLIVGGPIRHVSIPSGKEKRWIREDLQGLVRRKARMFIHAA